MATAQHILERLGGVAKVARALGCPLTTVQGWKEANYVPDWRKPSLIALATNAQTDLSINEFPDVSERIPRKAAASSEQAAA